MSYLGEIAGCAGMFESAGSPMSPEVALQFIILVFLSSAVIFVAGVLIIYGLVVPAVAWKAPKLSLLLELSNEIM